MQPIEAERLSDDGLAVPHSPGEERGIRAEGAHVGGVVVAVDGVPRHGKSLGRHRIADGRLEHAGDRGIAARAVDIS